jgi:tetratricopeptide (TPR) repeat protein
MRAAEVLIDELRSGQLAPSDLNWREFQEVVFHLVSDRLRLQFPTVRAELSDHEKGIIDIVLEYPSRTLDLAAPEADEELERCFIECKRYTRHIELDTAAKAFCAAIHHRPRQLWLVTLNGLSPQAWEYARHFFETGPTRQSLTPVRFGHVLLETLLDGAREAPPCTASLPSATAHPRITRWQLLEHTTFYNRELASDQNCSLPVHLQCGNRHTLRVWMQFPWNTTGNAPRVHLMGAAAQADPRFSELVFLALSDSELEIEAEVAPPAPESSTLLTEVPGQPLVVSIVTPNGPTSIQVPFPRILFHSATNLLGDLRANESAALAAQLASVDGQHVTFVSGDAGIGKSYLCQQAAALLNCGHGYTARAYSVLAAADQLVLRIALSLLTPVGAATAREQFVLHGALRAWLAQDGGDVGEAAPAAYKDYLAGGPATVDAALVSTCARLLAGGNSRQLLYVHNCQDLSPQEIKALALLLAELDSAGWGGVKLLLEYRDGDEPAQAAWTAFVKNVLRNVPASREVRVSPLAPSRIVRAVESTFLTDDPRALVEALVSKAGGNPLYLNQVIQHFTEVGACRQIVDERGKSRLVVDHWVTIRRRLEELPERLQPFLRSRLRSFLEHASGHEGTELPFGEYLALRSAAGPAFGRNRLAEALGEAESRLAEMEWRLIRANVLVTSSAEEGVAFVHDLMRLAAAEVGREAPSFRSAAERMERQLSDAVEAEALLGGTLNLWLHRNARALQWFETAYQAAHARGDYGVQREALLGSSKAAEVIPARSLQEKLRSVELLVALGWNEMQTGSQLEAVTVYRRALERADALLRNGGIEEHRVWRHEDTHIRHRIVTCLLHVQKYQEALDMMERLVGDIVEPERLFHTLNRFVRFCCITNHPAAGWSAAQTACGLAETLDDDCVSIIMSDIGHMYELVSPARSLQLWKRGLALAREIRQRTHSYANVLIGEMLSRGGPAELGEFEECVRTVTHHGITGQLTRLYLYAGVRSAVDGDWDQALHWWGRALANARLCSQTAAEWGGCNNLGIAALMKGDMEQAERYLSVAASLALPLLDALNADAVEKLAGSFALQARELCQPHQAFHLDKNFITTWEAPPLTGVHWRLAHNLVRLQAKGQAIVVPAAVTTASRGASFAQAAALFDAPGDALSVETPAGRLSLVIE